MSILKVIAAKLPAFDRLSLDGLPPAIKGKVCFIATLIDQATLLLKAKQTFPEKISDDSFLNGSSAPEDSQDELSKILDGLFKPLFPKENDDFDTHLNKLKARPKLIFEILKIIYEKCPDCGQRIWNSINEGYTQSSGIELINRYYDNIELMEKLDYEPASELTELFVMLQELLFYWLTWPLSQITKRIAITCDLLRSVENALAGLKDQAPETIKERLKVLHDGLAGLQDSCLDIEAVKALEAALDLSLAKIAYQVGGKAALIRQWGRREGNRTVKGSQRKKADKATNAQPVIGIFHSLKFPKEVFPKGASLHKVAGLIENILKDTIKDPPSIYTIKRALKNDEEIWKQFKVKGRNYFFKQM